MLRLLLKYLLSLFFVVAGSLHFFKADFYLKIMPPYLPFPLLLVWASGAAEIGLGLLLLVPKFTRIAAWSLIALLIAVFPANIYLALHPEILPDVSPAAHWLRLPFQGVFILWAYWFTRPTFTPGLGRP